MARQGDALFTQAALHTAKKAARARGQASAVHAELHMRRGVPRQAEPRRTSWAYAAAEWHGAACGPQQRALPAHHAAHAHSPFSPAAGASQGPLGAVCSLHARSL